LSSKLPFREAATEVTCSHQTSVSEATCRRYTYRHGQAAEAVAQQKTLPLPEGELSEAPEKMMFSVDGSFIQLTNGEWREVKSIAIGEFGDENERGTIDEVKTSNLSYFTRCFNARTFEQDALAELQRRRVEEAKTVVTVNDGAVWIQNFIDYHCPTAVRILDFAHALSHVGDAGKTIWGDDSDIFPQWFARCAHQLKHKPPHHTLAEIKLLYPKAQNDHQIADLDRIHFYLQRRQELIDYPFFRKRGYPIGSGCVESGHKVVVQRRLKGAGMRWAEAHVNPLLALRDLICNGRWHTGWQAVVTYQQQQKNQKRRQKVQAKQPQPSEPITFKTLEASGQLSSLIALKTTDDCSSHPEPEEKCKTWRPSEDHPWKRNIWPSQEAHRWSHQKN
jgi:hypothetical protein